MHWKLHQYFSCHIIFVLYAFDNYMYLSFSSISLSLPLSLSPPLSLSHSWGRCLKMSLSFKAFEFVCKSLSLLSSFSLSEWLSLFKHTQTLHAFLLLIYTINKILSIICLIQTAGLYAVTSNMSCFIYLKNVNRNSPSYQNVCWETYILSPSDE